jgi:hypothetical protein
VSWVRKVLTGQKVVDPSSNARPMIMAEGEKGGNERVSLGLFLSADSKGFKSFVLEGQ